ncbi:ATP:cob(I)alamin adenosyltransferase [Halobacteriales archaeon SW_8_65_20]|nr:MAG: ATP:cob(I)alamin adenosyltransferase [Halobacteriales archaeon SW_8_65_20]
MKVYTGRGDKGMTDLRDMSRVSKTSFRIEAYGTLDEVNSAIGVLRPTGYDDMDDQLREIQNHLHIMQADLATPDPEDTDTPHIQPSHTEWLEELIDGYDEELEPLESFILPGGSETGARLHQARAVCRRAERRCVDLAGDEPINAEVVTYLNRLSDALFTLARAVNARDGMKEESPQY